MLQARTIIENSYSAFSIQPKIINTSLTTLNSINGMVDGYIMLDSGMYAHNVNRTVSEYAIAPMSSRNIGTIYMPVYGARAYYITDLTLSHDGQIVSLARAVWGNDR